MAGRTPARESWTTPADVTDVLRRRWDRGDFLAASAAGADWQPVAVPIRAPTAREIAASFTAAQAWAERWRAADPRLFRIEHRTVGGRHVGANTLPHRAWIDTSRQLWQILGVTRQAQRFDELAELTRRRAPALIDYLATQPMKVLHHEQHWAALVDTVLWVEANTGTDLYLRQVDVPGVDTKFIEQHRSVLAGLLDRQLSGHRITGDVPASDFAGRYGFRKKPAYARIRRLDPAVDLAGPYSDIAIRVDELVATPLPAATVYVVENEVTYLAFPPAPDAVVIFGGGYALSTLQPLRWLTERHLIYWGDIDTHGFAILSRLRQLFPATRSMLMDRATLLAHRTQWVREPAPASAHLPALDDREADLYRELVEGVLGPSIRLEQERIRFSAVRAAMSNGLPPAAGTTTG